MTAWIPPNFSDNGGFFAGMLKKRNTMEAAAFLFVFFLINKIFAQLFGAAAAAVSFCVVALPITLLLLMGYKGDSLCTVLWDYIVYRKVKTVLCLRMPQIPRKEKNKRLWHAKS